MAKSRSPREEEPVEDEQPQDRGSLADRARESMDFEAWLQEQVKKTPWWAISMAAHAMGLALLSVVTFSHARVQSEEVPIIVTVPPPKIQKIEIERPQGLVERKGVPTGDVTPQATDEPAIYFPDAEESDHNESADGEDYGQMKGDSKEFISYLPGEGGGAKGRQTGKGPGLTDAIGVGGGGGGAGRYGGPFGGRVNRRAKGGGTKGSTDATENAVTAGLRWLARHQNSDGSWDAESYSGNCKKSICEGKGYRDYNVGLTGLSLLAFLGAGYTHLSRDKYMDPITGKEMSFGTVVKQGILYLIKSQDSDGCFGAKTGGKMLYNHAVASLAMAEAYGLTQSPLFKDPAQRGIDFLLASKNPYKAWRYQPKDGENDSSVTGWCVMAMKSAEISGLNVGRAAFEEALSFIDEITEKNYGKCGYTKLEDAGVKVVVQGKNEDYTNHESLTAVGMLVRIFCKHDPKDPILEMGGKLLVQDLPIWDKAKKTNDYYYWYYGTLALFQYDGPDSGQSQKYWGAWNKAMVDALVKNQATAKDQCAAGSWDSDDRWGFEGGRVYATALNVLTLEVYYRYDSAFGGGKRK
ncbi:MAG: terpene cyclase/mutase family protein [Planctomycetes bacterium]|nr:terpene cyclase/mutase family protein [Planctomycetota bacterium]